MSRCRVSRAALSQPLSRPLQPLSTKMRRPATSTKLTYQTSCAAGQSVRSSTTDVPVQLLLYLDDQFGYTVRHEIVCLRRTGNRIMMSHTARVKLARQLGPSPMPAALAYWVVGLGFCLAAWQIDKMDHVIGSIMLGLSTFVNLFCFMQGVNRMRRALARSLTLYRAAFLDLNPEHVCHEAGFIVMDGRRGMLVCNGRVASYADITRIVCVSTWLANKIELYGRTRFPLILGFRDRDSLLEHGRALRADIARARGTEPEFVLKDERATADTPAGA